MPVKGGEPSLLAIALSAPEPVIAASCSSPCPVVPLPESDFGEIGWTLPRH